MDSLSFQKILWKFPNQKDYLDYDIFKSKKKKKILDSKKEWMKQSTVMQGMQQKQTLPSHYLRQKIPP